MSLSPYTSMTGIESYVTLADRRKACACIRPLRSSNFGKSCGRGAIAAYDLYIGVSFIASAMAAPTAARCGSISANLFCAYGAERTTSRRTDAGC